MTVARSTQPSTAPITTVTLDHWFSPRLPAGHPLHERWSLMHGTRALLTFGSEDEARAAAQLHGWSIAATTPLVRQEGVLR